MTILITVAISLLISAFFAAAETAVTVISDVTIHNLIKNNNKKALLIKRLREDTDRLISTLLIANSLLNIFASSLTTAAFIKMFGGEGVIYATFVMATTILIFAEIIPKVYAFKYTEPIALFVAPILHRFMQLLYPFTTLIYFIITILTKFTCRKTNKKENKASSLQELRHIVNFQYYKGLVPKQQFEMIDGILDLREVDVQQVMVHRKYVNMLNIDSPIEEILAKICESTHTRIPFWHKSSDNIIGILHVRRVLDQLIKNRNDLTRKHLKSLLISPWFIPSTTPLLSQLHAFRERKQHFAIVVNEYGEMMGIVTLEDILEEVVGRIDDEYDQDIQDFVEINPSTYEVSGTFTVRDLNRHLGSELPEDIATTVSGLVMSKFGTIPSIGEKVTFNNITFAVISTEQHHITRLKIEINDDNNLYQ